MARLLSILFFVVAASGLQGQIAGCIDPAALNYNPAATFNDGSCVYGPSSANPNLISTVSDSLQELSGLVSACNALLGHNDGGNIDRLFRLNQGTGAILQSTALPLSLTDWEDVAVSQSHIFLGDVGNNSGQRDTLSIYRIPLTQLCTGSVQTIDTIQFWYADAPSGILHPDSHNLDCEGLAVYRDSLWLFSKNRVGNRVRIYGLSTTPGKYGIQALDSIVVDGQITGADIIGDSCMALVGYAPPLYTPFLILGFASDLGAPWKGCVRRIDLGSVFQMGQLEAVCFWSGHSLRFGSEAVSALGLGPRLYSLDVGSYLSIPNLGSENLHTGQELWCKKKSEELQIKGLIPGKPLEVFNAQGQRLILKQEVEFEETIRIPTGSDSSVCRQADRRTRCLVER